ncbi:MAG: hypothetical protein GY758_34730, partial [Fuerstiella sp.]|nr:hypothetical protein [Fuerstiella sp.]
MRSMRPSEHHIAGFTSAGVPVRRYLDAANTADAAAIASLPGAHGAFPLRPDEGVNSSDFGKLGVFTGHDPGTAGGPDADNIQLDSDNDGDSIKEGIWMDLAYPIQETTSGELYATMFSFTIYDLDSLIDLNSHGNISELARNERVLNQLGTAVAGPGRSSPLGLTFLSASNQGLGPNEISPLWALAPSGATPDSGLPFTEWFNGADPMNRLEQANMEWLWLLTGRIDGTDVFDGRWGDASALWYHRFTDGNRSVWSLPRPGRAGRLTSNASTGSISFGGKQGADDNRNALEGIASTRTGVIRGFMHPLDVGGTGKTFRTSDPRIPLLSTGDATRPEQWLQYDEYPIVGSASNVLNDSRFLKGRDQNYTSTADNQYVNARYNMAFEDSLEFLNDIERAVHPDDQIFRPSDLVPAHLASTDIGSAQTTLSSRLSDLAPFAFANSSSISDRFTTLTNSLRTIIHRHDLGLNLVSDSGTGDDGPRWWEWTTDFDGDGRGEFPPRFGPVGTKINAFANTDPFRKVVRRLLTSEAGESRDLISQLPLSVNHILDVNRSSETPPETSPAFLDYMLRTGMRLRPVTEHPDANETDAAGATAAASVTSVPTIGTPEGTAALQTFPPRTFKDREFWARRDRQKLARDIYVLLYTLGGGQTDGGTPARIIDYTVTNDPSAAPGASLYTHEQLRRMAQFAVNMVDAMDTDDVVTMFEYDKNLGDGWNMDDDAFTNTVAENPTSVTGTSTDNGLYPHDTEDRGIVFGVEAQQLSFSEVMAVRMEDMAKHDNMMADDAATRHADASSAMVLVMPESESLDRHVLHIELQNNQPYPVPLSVDGVTGNATTGSGHKAIWQLARFDRDFTVGGGNGNGNGNGNG